MDNANIDLSRICDICEEEIDLDCDTVKKKGLKNFISISKTFGDDKWETWQIKDILYVHKKCRVLYYNNYARKKPTGQKRKQADVSTVLEGSDISTNNVHEGHGQKRIHIDVSTEPEESDISVDNLQEASGSSILHEHSSAQSNRSDSFDFNNLCVLCEDKLHPTKQTVRQFTGQIDASRFIAFIRRHDFADGEDIINRIQKASASQTYFKYHAKCYDKIKYAYVPSNNQDETEVAFGNLFNYIENSEQFRFTLKHLHEKLGSFDCDTRTLKKKLVDKFGDEIIIMHGVGRQGMAYYKFNIQDINEQWCTNPEALEPIQKKIILTMAADIIKREIHSSTYEHDSYPPSNSFLDDVKTSIPPHFNGFLEELLETDKDNLGHKSVVLENIAHSVISLLLPRSFISSLQLAVGTYAYRKTGSKLIINLLSALGVTPSYEKLRLFEASTIMNPPAMIVDDNVLVQHVFDNTDHNVYTIDGRDTFHCLGGIASYTPHYSITYEGRSKKLTKMPKAAELASQKQIEIAPFLQLQSDALSDIEFEDVDKLMKDIEQKCNRKFLVPTYSGYLWAKNFGIEGIPSWKGFMEKASNEDDYQVSHIGCLPFINEPPSDLTTLNTALNYALQECEKLKQKTCFITYDQPLYIKMRFIVAHRRRTEGLNNVIVRLGGFHLLMSFLKSIGFIMDGSGLEDLWATAYARGSIKKMLDGHAYARAIRAHILSFTALGIFICKKVESGYNDDNLGMLRNHVENFFEKWKFEPPSMNDFNADPTMTDLNNTLISFLEKAEKIGKTAKLWTQYMKCVIIALEFIEAERTGNWNLHLVSVKKMLPVFHATGHFAYAKSAQIYLQDMAKLELSMKDHNEYENFINGGFTIRRSDKNWSGVWTDMVIEQTLNRFFGNDLRHGRGVTPSVVARYLHAMPTAVNIMEALENYCKFKSESSEQHVDLATSRKNRDLKDIQAMVSWFEDGNDPFRNISSLVSFSTGVIGDDSIDCHQAIEKGLLGMKSMIGSHAGNVTLSKKQKVVPLSTAVTSILTSNMKTTNIDSDLIFQKIAISLKDNPDALKNALNYELSVFPQSLFDKKGFMRKSSKAELYKYFSPQSLPSITESSPILKDFIYVLDGGWLLHNVSWPHSSTWQSIFNAYLKNVVNRFGTNCIVVFDGYDTEVCGTKSYERFRRKEKNVPSDFDIREKNLVTMQREKFLLNVANKFKLVRSLAQFFLKNNVQTKIAKEDADALIVKTALELKNRINRPVCVVGNDTDLLILCIGLTNPLESLYFYKIAASKTKKPNQLYMTRSYKVLKPYILFAHSFAGCDTTSSFYKKGKRSILKILGDNEHLQRKVEKFYVEDQSIDVLLDVAKEVTIHLYRKKNVLDVNITLNQLRYALFNSGVTVAKKRFDLALLPPTESVLKQHAKRVYYQIQLWLGAEAMDPTQWGWTRFDNTLLLPLMNEDEPAPEELLKNISCGCKTGCSSTSACTCRKSGLKCTEECKNCFGKCTNQKEPQAAHEEEEEDQSYLHDNLRMIGLDDEDKGESDDDEHDEGGNNNEYHDDSGDENVYDWEKDWRDDEIDF